jgi:hypothetical protein
MAAIRAARRGRRVVLLEKNRRPGVKILISGGTRCNVTNATDARGIIAAFGPGGRFLGPALRALDPPAAIRFFEDAGLATKVEDDIVRGKVFPASDRATDVLDALLRELEKAGATLLCEAPVAAVRARPGGGFELETARGGFEAARVLVATGGKSYPRSGTTGDGYAIARAFGHALVEPRPALVPLVAGEAWVHDLRGVTIPRARVRGFSSGRLVAERTGSLLFTHFGLSGPAALDLSSPLARAARDGEPRAVEMDFLPDVAAEALEADLRDAAAKGGGARLVKSAVALPDRLAETLVRDVAKVAADRRLAALSKDERRRVVAAVKQARVAVAGDRGFAQAEVTSGGVDLAEVDPKTLESRKQPGLHFAGEVLDLDGPIGGFNFQAAWSTGWLAGTVA